MNFLVVILSTLFFVSSHPAFAQSTLTPQQAYQAVKDGNARYLTEKSKHTRIDAERRVETATYGQKPIAAILGCADSRVPPEIVLDQGFADLFVVRVAGNVAGQLEKASLEYSTAVLQTPLIVVLGHSKCGAVDTALNKKPPFPGSIAALVDHINPAIAQAKSESKNAKPDALLDLAIDDNVLHTMEELLTQSPIIKDAVQKKKLMVVGGTRNLKTGKIHWLGEHPKQSKLIAAK